MARILVIEDNPDNLELMTYLLNAFGHVPLVARDGEEGLATARLEPPDLIVCDIHMPKLDGYGLAREIRADPRFGRVPLVAVTALAMVGDRDRVLAGGFDGYIGKPIDPTSFVAEVESFLKGKAPVSARPAAAGNPAAPEAQLPPIAQVSHVRVLVVDDSRNNRDLIEITLRASGYAVTLAENVREALQLAEQVSPDLILSDLHMPNTDGFEFLSKVKSEPKLSAIPFVFISSSVWGHGETAKALALGATRFLLRPIEPQELLREIAAILLLPKGEKDGDYPDR